MNSQFVTIFFTINQYFYRKNNLTPNIKFKPKYRPSPPPTIVFYLPTNRGSAVNSRFLEILNLELLCRLSFFIDGAVKLRPFAIGVCGGGVGRSLVFYRKKKEKKY